MGDLFSCLQICRPPPCSTRVDQWTTCVLRGWQRKAQPPDHVTTSQPSSRGPRPPPYPNRRLLKNLKVKIPWHGVAPVVVVEGCPQDQTPAINLSLLLCRQTSFLCAASLCHSRCLIGRCCRSSWWKRRPAVPKCLCFGFI